MAGVNDAALLRWLDELSGAGIFTTDAGLLVQTWNRWMERHTKIAAADAIGQPLLELYPDLRDRGLDAYYRAALEGEVRVLARSLHRYVLRVPSSIDPGEPMPQSGRIAPLIEDGAVIGTVTVIDDVSERVQNEREMRRQIIASETARATAENALRMKDEFLANLSHEIRTPLNAVIGWTRILLSGKPDAATVERALRVIDRNASAQAKLIEDMLDMARILTGKLRLNLVPVDLVGATRAALDVVLPAAEAKSITLRAVFPEQPAPITADPDRVQQIAWNILSNAVKFTPSGGNIDVRVEATEGVVRLVVTDSGAGIAPEFLPHIFERFRQADASTSRTEGGLGLGLALVQDLVHLHGGVVAVRSEGRGHGAEVTVTFPAATLDTAPMAETTLPDASLLRGQTVLIVDDDPDWRDLLSLALFDAGARPMSAASTKDALALLTSALPPPRVIVTDIAMPRENGYVLMESIRSHGDRLSSVPVIAITAYAAPAEEARARAAGFQGFRAKPLPPDEAIATIVSVLKALDPAV